MSFSTMFSLIASAIGPSFGSEAGGGGAGGGGVTFDS